MSNIKIAGQKLKTPDSDVGQQQRQGRERPSMTMVQLTARKRLFAPSSGSPGVAVC